MTRKTKKFMPMPQLASREEQINRDPEITGSDLKLIDLVDYDLVLRRSNMHHICRTISRRVLTFNEYLFPYGESTLFTKLLIISILHNVIDAPKKILAKIKEVWAKDGDAREFSGLPRNRKEFPFEEDHLLGFLEMLEKMTFESQYGKISGIDWVVQRIRRVSMRSTSYDPKTTNTPANHHDKNFIVNRLSEERYSELF